MKIKKMLTTLFILFHFLVMIRIFIPLNTPFFGNLYRPIDSYLSFFSIYQDWMMFAPNPSRYESQLYSLIEFEDGSVEKYEFGSEIRNLWAEKLYKEKMRKLFEGSILNNQNMLNDLAKFSLRKARKNHFKNLPIKVTIYKKSFFTPNLDTKFIPYNETKSKNEEQVLFTYEVI